MNDGALARRFATSSHFGQQSDSLADLLSFAAAPAALAYFGLRQARAGWQGMAARYSRNR